MCKKHTVGFNICFEQIWIPDQGLSVNTVMGIFWHFAENKIPKENGLFFFQKDTEPFQAELVFFGWVSPPLNVFIRHLQTTALKNLFKYVWKTAQ